MELFYTGERLHPKQDDLNAINYIKQYKFISSYLEGKTVLDNACGNGIGSEFFLEFGKPRKLIGIDISEDAVKNAKKRFKDRDDAEFHTMDSTNLTFEDSSFESIVSLATLEHIKDYEKYVTECKRVLKKDGILIVETPNSKHFANLKSPHDFHEKEFLAHELKTLLERHFKIEKFLGVSFSQRGMDFIHSVEKKRKNFIFEFAFSNFYLPLSIYVPKGLKKTLRNRVSTNSDFNEDDIIISPENVEDAWEFIVVCKKE